MERLSLHRSARLLDGPTGVTQEAGHTGWSFLRLPSAVLALMVILENY